MQYKKKYCPVVNMQFPKINLRMKELYSNRFARGVQTNQWGETAKGLGGGTNKLGYAWEKDLTLHKLLHWSRKSNSWNDKWKAELVSLSGLQEGVPNPFLPLQKEKWDPFCEICLIIQHGLKPIHFKYPDGIFIRRMLYTWEE